MVRGDRCCVGTCDNDTRYQERFVVKGHVQKLMFHRFPRNEEKRKTWTSLIAKGRSGFTLSDASRIFSNHFKDGQPTTKNPNPTLWLTIQDNRENKVLYKRKSPRKRVFTENVEANKKEAGKKPRENVQEEKNANNFLLPVPIMMTEHLNHQLI